jgi:hypothetical protein
MNFLKKEIPVSDMREPFQTRRPLLSFSALSLIVAGLHLLIFTGVKVVEAASPPLRREIIVHQQTVITLIQSRNHKHITSKNRRPFYNLESSHSESTRNSKSHDLVISRNANFLH